MDNWDYWKKQLDEYRARLTIMIKNKPESIPDKYRVFFWIMLVVIGLILLFVVLLPFLWSVLVKLFILAFFLAAAVYGYRFLFGNKKF